VGALTRVHLNVRHRPYRTVTPVVTLRWEYDRSTPNDRHPRHHAQMRADVTIGTGALDLDRAHLPTGWVTLEEVIRFLIVELEIDPPCGDKWPEELAESERRFYGDFTGKRYKLPDAE
jgi:hypothetical protein